MGYYLGYARKSQEAEDRQMQSIGDQTRFIKQLAAEKNFNLLTIYSEAKSAKQPGREAFGKLLNQVSSRDDITGIICWKVNRLSRNPVDTGQLQWALQSGKIKEIVTPQKTYTVNDSDFVLAIEGAQAQRFIRDLQDDTRRGLNSKVESGWFPGLAPTGYLNDKHMDQGRKTISPHPLYFDLVRKLFELALTGEYSISQLHRISDELGIKNSRNKPVSRTQLYIMMKNPFYVGKFKYKNQVHKGKHQPMLDSDEFDLLQAIVSGRGHPRQHVHNHLSGLITCGACGYQVSGETRSKKYKNGTIGKFTYYHCSHVSRGCSQPRVNAKKIDSDFNEYLSKIEVSDSFIVWGVETLNEMSQDSHKVLKAQHEALRRSYDQAKTQLGNLVDLYSDPTNIDKSILTFEEYQDRRERYISARDKAKHNMNKLDLTGDVIDDLTVKTFEFTTNIQNRFKYGDIDEKKFIMRSTGSNLILIDGQLEIVGREPFEIIKAHKKAHSNSFEPATMLENTAKNNAQYPQMSVWGG